VSFGPASIHSAAKQSMNQNLADLHKV